MSRIWVRNRPRDALARRRLPIPTRPVTLPTEPAGSSWDHVRRRLLHTRRPADYRPDGDRPVLGRRADLSREQPGRPASRNPDRRLLVIDPEFASVLKSTTRPSGSPAAASSCSPKAAIWTRSRPAGLTGESLRRSLQHATPASSASETRPRTMGARLPAARPATARD
jgi:hypothetical protein